MVSARRGNNPHSQKVNDYNIIYIIYIGITFPVTSISRFRDIPGHP